jgi:hypothetical protein
MKNRAEQVRQRLHVTLSVRSMTVTNINILVRPLPSTMANTPPPTNAQGTLPSPISTQHAEVSSATLSPVSQSPPPEPAPLSRAFKCGLAIITLLPVGTLARLELLPFRVILLFGVASVDHNIEDRNIAFSFMFLITLALWGCRSHLLVRFLPAE